MTYKYYYRHPRTGQWVECSEADYNTYKANGVQTRRTEVVVSPTPTPTPSPSPTPTPSTPSTTYSVCSGPNYQKWCKDSGAPNPNGTIYKVQGCIGASQDSLFGPKTEKALKAKTGKKTFTSDEIATICDESVVDSGQSKPQTVDDQRKYWNDLIENEQIWRQGYIFEKNGKVVYIIKTDLDNPDVKYPLENLKGADLSKFDYIVMFIPQTGSKVGKWGLLIKKITTNGEEKVGIQTNPQWTWEPNEKEEYFDLLENRIKNILKNKIQEQKFYGRSKKTDDSKGINTSGGRTVSGTENKTDNKVVSSEPAKVDPTKVKEVIDPIRVETIGLLEEIKGMTFFQVGATPDDKKQLDEAIKLLQNFDSSKACETENQKLIDQNLVILNDMISKNENKFGAGNIVGKAKQVRSNLERVKTECKRLASELQSQLQQKGDGSNVSDNKTELSVQDSNDLLRKFGFVRPDGKTYNPKEKIEKLGKQKLGESGSGTLQSAIDNSGARSYYFADYNKIVASVGLSDEFKLKIPMSSPQQPGKVIDEKNESILFPLEDQQSKNEFTKTSFSEFINTNTTLEIYIGKRKGSTALTSKTSCPFDAAGARNYLIQYLVNGLTASDTVIPKPEEKQTLCACYKSGVFDNFKPIEKEELKGMTKKEKPTGWLFNRRLTWKDVERLMRGEEISGEALHPNFHDDDFATQGCVEPMRESLKRTIRQNITEAIKSKKLITESIKSKILKDINRRY